jgi:hypothetical protein
MGQKREEERRDATQEKKVGSWGSCARWTDEGVDESIGQSLLEQAEKVGTARRATEGVIGQARVLLQEVLREDARGQRDVNKGINKGVQWVEYAAEMLVDHHAGGGEGERSGRIASRMQMQGEIMESRVSRVYHVMQRHLRRTRAPPYTIRGKHLVLVASRNSIS